MHEHSKSHSSESEHDEHSASSDHDHDHDHDSAEEHSEINANYVWTCNDTSILGLLELHFIKGFASVDKIEVQIITPAGAQVVTAGSDAQWISLTLQ